MSGSQSSFLLSIVNQCETQYTVSRLPEYLTMRLLFLLPLFILCHGAALPEAENFDLETIIDTFHNFALNSDK